MTDSLDLAAHLCQLEESLLDPAVRRDRARLESLLSADFLEFGSSGRIWTHKEIVEQLAQESLGESHETLTLTDFYCVELSPQAALVTWRAIRTNTATGQSATSLRSSVWIQDNNEWRLRFHQGTPAA